MTILCKDIVLVSGLVAFLFVWFETKAFIEWARLLRLQCLVKPYLEAQNSPVGNLFAKNYVDFLNYKYGQNFFIKILVCPECLSVWLNLITFFLVGKEWLLPNIVATWFVFHLLRRVAKYE